MIFQACAARHPAVRVTELRGGVLLPGFIDTHVHFPQVRIIGGLGRPLLDWLDHVTLPEEARLQDNAYARAVARDFLRGLSCNGTTTALVFGSHFKGAMEVFFEEAAVSGLRTVAGQVVSDRMLRPELHTTPELAYAEGRALIERWHGVGRARYAVTPRFSLSASEGVLAACAALMNEFPDVHFTSPHQRERRGSPDGAGAVPRQPGLPGHLRACRAAGPPGRAGPQRPHHGPRTGTDGRAPAAAPRIAHAATPRWAAACSP